MSNQLFYGDNLDVFLNLLHQVRDSDGETIRQRFDDSQTRLFVAILQLRNEDTPNPGLVSKVFLRPFSLLSQRFDSVSESLTNVLSHPSASPVYYGIQHCL